MPVEFEMCRYFLQHSSGQQWTTIFVAMAVVVDVNVGYIIVRTCHPCHPYPSHPYYPSRRERYPPDCHLPKGVRYRCCGGGGGSLKVGFDLGGIKRQCWRSRDIRGGELEIGKTVDPSDVNGHSNSGIFKFLCRLLALRNEIFKVFWTWFVEKSIIFSWRGSSLESEIPKPILHPALQCRFQPLVTLRRRDHVLERLISNLGLNDRLDVVIQPLLQ